MNLSALRARLQKATPGPWAWGDDWAILHEGDKYAELSLFGGEGQEIIPLRIDHYVPRWQTAKGAEPSAADRELIAHAPTDLAACVEALSEARFLLQHAKFPIPSDAQHRDAWLAKVQP